METKFNFNSQICTTREQSEHLLALGLKKETADMHHYRYSEGYWDIQACPPRGDSSSYIPAWSLLRLLSMLPDDAPKIYWILDGASITIKFEDVIQISFHIKEKYEGVVKCIEWLIEEEYFNKEYLV